jgi:outer membrane protein assembly factor BamB
MARLGVVAVVASLVACGGAASAPGHEPVVVPVQPSPPPAPPSSDLARAKDPTPAASVDPDVAPLPFRTAGRVAGPTPRLRDAAPRALATRWTARVGKTTFRTTMALEGATVVIGTHGDSLKGANEASDAVYVLDAKTGKTTRKIAAPGAGDKDVGGVAIDAGHVVFTTDNGQVVKARLDTGAVVWTAKLGGKVRPAPALADLDATGAKDVVVGDEHGTLHALSGDTGKAIWTRDTGRNDYDAGGFVAAAAIADLDNDGRDDVVAGARDGHLVAYRGRDGVEMWRQEGDSGIHASPSIVDVDGDGRMEVLAAWSYSRVALFDAKTGALRWEQSLELDSGGIEGLFASPVPIATHVKGGAGAIVQPTSWWGGRRGGKHSNDGIVVAGQERRIFRTDEGRVSATAIVMDIDDDAIWDAVVGTEAGELLAISPDRGTRALLAKLAGGVEAPAMAADVDGDGTYELLVASNDGNLTCFSTGSRTKPLVPRFRGASTDNRGALGAIPLDWSTREAGHDLGGEDRPARRRSP